MRDILTDRELAGELDIPHRRLEQWRYLGTGPAFVRIGRSVRYRRDDVEAWLASQTVTPAASGAAGDAPAA